MEKCEDFFREIEKETQKENFNFAEIEENEHEYEKLDSWLEKVIRRDFFGASLKEPSVTALKKCKTILDSFSEKVYERNSEK